MDIFNVERFLKTVLPGAALLAHANLNMEFLAKAGMLDTVIFTTLVGVKELGNLASAFNSVFQSPED